MKRALISSLLATAFAGVAFAGTQDQAVLALHVQAHAAKATLTCAGQKNNTSLDPNTKGIHCGNYVITSKLVTSDVYLVVANGRADAGVAGLSCGIDYPAALSASGWILCADLDFPNGGWPSPGGGNRITWAPGTRCQDGSAPEDQDSSVWDIMNLMPGHGRDYGPGQYNVHAIAGAFYMYSYGGAAVLQVTPNNGAGSELRVADCSSAESDVTMGGGAIGYNGASGFNPCLSIVPTEVTTWGAIKAKTSE
jgi:hypothetical protein